VRNDDLARVRMLLAQGTPVDGLENGHTTFYLAAQEGRLDLLQLLLDQGAEVNTVPVPDDGWTPLIVATYRGHRAVVAWLLDHGADIDARDRDGYSALGWDFKEWG